MKFRKGNKIYYGQDHHLWRGIPSGVDFEVTRSGHSYKLVADGYGDLHGQSKYGYGNGALYPHHLTRKQIKQFEKYLETEEK